MSNKLSPQSIQELIQIIEKDYGVKLTNKDAFDLGKWLISFYENLM